jgi:hypothetical protein
MWMLNNISPLKIVRLFQYSYMKTVPTPPAPAYKEADEWFIQQGLLSANYKITDRGRVYLEALKLVPLPELKWVIPKVDR